MSIIDTLITDRSASDTAALEAIFEKAKAGTLTDQEKSVLASPAHKGAYNYTDLNRVNEAMTYLVEELERRGYMVLGYEADHTVWSEQTIPTRQQMQQYIANVSALRNAVDMPANTPSAPADMEAFTADEANAIERILSSCAIAIHYIDTAILRSAQPLLYSGFAVYISHTAYFMFVYTKDDMAVYTADGMPVQVIQ